LGNLSELTKREAQTITIEKEELFPLEELQTGSAMWDLKFSRRRV
jgi:hypothetical protein